LNEGKYTLSDISPENLSDLCAAITDGTISNTAGKTVMDELFASDKTVKDIIAEKGLSQISDVSALEIIVDEVLSLNAQSIEDYKNGKTNVLGFLVGQCMRASKGQGNPQMFNDMIERQLSSFV
jgi:aspartyl-tRNA(Asn)/glutamyl-tRNA(Gln) amidotransferase subunit B